MTTGQGQELRSISAVRRWAGRHWVSIVLVLVGLVYGGAVTVLHEDTVSPIDEVVYLDYAFKVWEQGVVHEGEKFGDDVAHVVACENVIPFGDLGQKCGSDKVHLAGMPNHGYTTGAGYTPVYFWSVRIIGDPIHAVTGLSEVTSWRISGLVWLAGTLLVLVPLLRRAGVSAVVTLTLGLLFIASPYSWWTYTYLSTDASVVLFGAAILLVAMEVVRGRRSAWWLLPLAALAPIFKITNLLVFGLVLLYLAIDAVARLRRRREGEGASAPTRSARTFWLPVIVAVVVAGAVQVAWMRVIPLLSVSDVVVDQGVATPLTATELVRLMLSGIGGPITHNPFAGFSSSPLPAQIVTPLSWLMIAAVIGAMMVLPWDSDHRPVVWATGVASLTALPALGIMMWGLTHSYFDLPARYGAGLIPAMLLVAGFMLRNRTAVAAALVYAGVLMVFGIGLAVHVGAAY